MVVVAAVATTVYTARHRPQLAIDADVEPTVRASESVAGPRAGTVLVDGIYLEPTRSPSRADCQELATAVRYTVPCPRRLPAPADGPDCGGSRCIFPGPHRSRARGPARNVGVVLQHRSFMVPEVPPWLGVRRNLVVTAVPVARRTVQGELRVAGPPELVSCFPPDHIVAQGPTVFRICVNARPWVRGAGGYPLQRHTAAVWRRGDVVYAGGVEGAGDHIDALLTALIEGIEYIDPP